MSADRTGAARVQAPAHRSTLARWLAASTIVAAIVCLGYSLADGAAISLRYLVSAAFGICAAGSFLAIVVRISPLAAAIACAGLVAGFIELALSVAGVPGLSPFAALPLDIAVCLAMGALPIVRGHSLRVSLGAAVVGAVALTIAWRGAVLFLVTVFPVR